MIQTIGKNKYKITIECGIIEGKRKRISKTFYGNKKDAKLFENDLKKNFGKGSHKEDEITFYQLIDIFINERCKNTIKDNTIYNYENLIKVIKKEISDINIVKIGPYVLQKYYNKLSEEYKYSSNTIGHHYTLINSIFELAVKWKMLEVNPNKAIEKPKIIKKESKFYDQQDVNKLLKVLENESLSHRVPIILCLDSGMRREELNGLLWEDIDFKTNTININKVRIAVGNKVVVEEPKTTNSKRKIVVSQYAINLLKELKKEQISNFKTLGIKFKESNYVFVNENGIEYYPDTLSKIFKKIIKKYELKKITFHELRHTSATLLISNNVDINSVSERLGHSNVSTTLNIYTHTLEKTKKEMARKMDNIFANN